MGRLCQFRSGRSDQVRRLSQVMSGQFRSGLFRKGEIMLVCSGEVRSVCKVSSSQVSSGQVRLCWSGQGKTVRCVISGQVSLGLRSTQIRSGQIRSVSLGGLSGKIRLVRSGESGQVEGILIEKF